MSEATSESRSLIGLATPVVITQVSTMMLGVVDIVMIGHVGVDSLGAASLGRVWVMGTLLFGLGVVLGMDPIVTQAHGSRDARMLGITLQRGIVLAVLTSAVLGLLWIATEPVLLAFGQEPSLARHAHSYVMVQIPSLPAFLVFTALRQYLQGREIVWPTMWVAIAASLVNVPFNWVLIYGHLGFPAMGLVGAGIATSLTRYFMLIALVVVVLKGKLHEGAWVPWSRQALEIAGLRKLVHYGLPVGIQIGLDVWAFQILTLMAGRLGRVELAANTIVLNAVSFFFMVPLGISFAAVTRVGNLIGANDGRGAQRSAWVALGMGAGFMTGAGVLLLALRRVVPRLYTSDEAVVAACGAAFLVAAVLMVFDGTQIVAVGIQRGMGRTRPAAAINLFGFYALGIPLAWWLAFSLGFGLPGLWTGLTIGVAAVAAMTTAWVWRYGPARVDARIFVGPDTRERVSRISM